MNTAALIAAGMIVIVLGVAGWGLILDWRDDQERDRLAAAGAVKRRKRVAEIAREHDRVTLGEDEKRLFREIAERAGQIKGESA